MTHHCTYFGTKSLRLPRIIPCNIGKKSDDTWNIILNQRITGQFPRRLRLPQRVTTATSVTPNATKWAPAMGNDIMHFGTECGDCSVGTFGKTFASLRTLLRDFKKGTTIFFFGPIIPIFCVHAQI